MGKSLLYASNTITQGVTTGSAVNFGSVVRRFGNAINISGGNVVVQGVGYFPIEVSLSFEATEGTAVIALYKDGTAIPGASATITTVADTNYSVTIPAVVRNKCCCESEITCVITGVTAQVSPASILVESL